jgi:hypothetical protein
MSEYYRRLGGERLYEDGPSLFTLHLMYLAFGLTPTDVKNIPEDEAQLLARYANQLYREGRLK